MGAILYPPEGMDYNEWLCDLMCPRPVDEEEEELQDFSGDENDRTRETKKDIK